MTEVTDLRLVGGRLCLDFVNTADWAGRRIVTEHLETPGDIHSWAHRVGLDLAITSITGSSAGSDDSEAVLDPIYEFRRRIREVLLQVVAGRRPSSADVRLLNRKLAAAGSAPLLRAEAGGLAYKRSGTAEGDLEVPVAISVVELLTSGDRRLVKQCAGARCGWLFLDDSRNRSRRWCSMETCGNRSKVRAHYARKTSGMPNA